MSFTAKLKTDDETGRLAALRRYKILDTAPEVEFEDIITLVKQVLNAPAVAISMIDSDRQWFKASSGVDATETPRAVAFCDHTIRDSKALRVDDTTQDPRFSDNPLVTGPMGLRCYLGVPLQSPDGYNVGTLCVFGCETREFSADDIAVLRSFGNLVMSQMELRLISQRDGLTGTMTRSAFEKKLRAVFDSAEKPDMTLLLLDIDLFKSINDTFGHQAGDAALRAVAGALQDSLRSTDSLGRYGGEEFVILLRDIATPDAMILTERLRGQVEALSIPEVGARRITISIGLAPYDDGLTSVEEWLGRADRALYEAKAAGRNQVMAA